MADNNTNGTDAPGASDNGQPQINVLGQYIKDLSFENPSAPRSLMGNGKPSIQINFNVQAQAMGEELFEVALTLEANATAEENVLYNLELVYAGGFRLHNLPKEAIQPVLFIECPALLFPFVRRLVGDLTREGGFPPLLLDPIDFASLFRQRMMQQGQAAANAAE
jgi:preprotein translocase subunit SecB